MPGRTSANTIGKRPVSAAGQRRPVSEYAAKKAAYGSEDGLREDGGGVSRYRGENIMRLALDSSGRTTRDYEGPAVAPRVQAALDAAMSNVEPDIDIDVGGLNSTSAVKGSMRGGHPAAAAAGSGNAAKKAKVNYFPSSRGLVPKK